MPMNSVNDALVQGLRSSKMMLRRYSEDLKPEEYLHRVTPKANCVAWLIGHLTLTDRRFCGLLNGSDRLPKLPEGFEKRFSRDEGCPQASEFGDTSNLLAVFDQNRDVLIDLAAKATPEQLNKPVENPRPVFSTPGEAMVFAAVHTMLHVGQITLIRRNLGRPPLS